MIENINAVNNPLTIIAIFAALAEIAGTVAIGLVEKNLQPTFVWFVMLFPVLLVLLFFLTLNFNPKVLYAPSDFKDEENFLNALYGASRLSINLDEVQKQLEEAKSQILEDTAKSIGIASENERQKLMQIVESRLNAIQDKVETTKESAEEVALNTSSAVSSDTTRERILELIKKKGGVLKGTEVVELLSKDGTNTKAIIWNLRQLKKNGALEQTMKNGIYIYRLIDNGLVSNGEKGHEQK